jgi:hypothetical protein
MCCWALLLLVVLRNSRVSLFGNSCLEHLLDNGADPSMVNSKGYSAVHYAAYHGNKQNLELVPSFLPLALCCGTLKMQKKASMLFISN